MKFFTKLINFVKKAVNAVAKLFKDKNPVEVINDASKTVAAVATAGLAIYAGVNAIRVHLIPTAKKNKSSKQKSGHDFIIENREAGSIDDKLAGMRKGTSKIGKKQNVSMKQEDLEILKSIAKTRNTFFQSLSPEEQMNVLEMEDFDFNAYKENYKKKSPRPLFPWGKRLRKLGVSPEDKPFRETVDYGFFNFILQPLDDFIHWIKNDPVPKKVKQISVVDKPEIPNIPCDTAMDVVDAARNLDSYLNHNKTVLTEFNGSSSASLEEQQILSEEIFRHRSLRKFQKAVNRRMANSSYNTPNIFELMDDDKDFKKSKKDKKKKKKNKDDEFSFVDKSSKKKSKKDDKDESAAEKRAKELYRYHLEKAMSGEIDRKGFKF